MATTIGSLYCHVSTFFCISATGGKPDRKCGRSFSAFCLRISAFRGYLYSSVDCTYPRCMPLSFSILKFPLITTLICKTA